MKISKIRVLSVLLALLLAISTFPFFTATASDTLETEIVRTAADVIENFDGGTNLGTLNAGGTGFVNGSNQAIVNNAANGGETYISLSGEHYNTGSYSLKFSTVGASNWDSSKYITVMGDRLNTCSRLDFSKTGIMMWVKNTATNAVKLTVWNRSDGSRATKSCTYYLEDSVGTVTTATTVSTNFNNNYGFAIPAGFEGWLYIPYAYFADITTANNNILRMAICQDQVTTGAFYIDSIMGYVESYTVNIIETFDEGTNLGTLKADGTGFVNGSNQAIVNNAANGGETYISLSSEHYNTGSYSLKFSTLGASNWDSSKYITVMGDRINTFGRLDLTKAGVKMWVKNTATNAVKMIVWNRSDGSRATKSCAYYLEDSEGTVTTATTVSTNFNNNYGFAIPAGFEGWLYIPYAYFADTTNASNNILRMAICQDQVTTGAFYLDSIVNYDEDPVSSVIETFEGFDSTQSLKDALANGNTTPLTVELDENAWGSNGLKITQADKDITGSVAVKFTKSDKFASFTGFKVRIKVNKDANMLIKSEDTAHRPMKANSIYYLVSSDGRAYSYKASGDSAALVQFVAGFDGWIYIPFASINQLNTTKAYRLWFNPQKTNEAGTTFVIDDIVFYSGNPTVINDTPIDFKVVLPYSPDNNLVNFDDCTSTNDMSNKINLNKGENVTVELDSTTAQDKNSCKFTFSENGGLANNIVAISKNSYYSEITGFRFWIKTSDAEESASLLYKVETTIHRPLKSRATYYLVDKNGKAIQRNASANNNAAIIAVPAGFEGWIYVPFDSLYPLEVADLHRIWFNFTVGANASKNIWLDSISCYKDNPIVPKTDVINDFDLYSGTADLLLDSNFQAQSEDGNYSISKTNYDGTSGKSFKIKTVEGGYKFLGLKSLNGSEYDGFIFYAKNPSNKDVYLLPQTDSAGRDSFIPGNMYYLESKTTGAVEMKQFETGPSDAGFVSIAAGFEGYVYLPYSSAYPSLQNNIDKLNSFWIRISKDIVTDAELYIDTVSFYKTSTCRISELLMWRQDTEGMLYGFEKNDSLMGYRGWISAKSDYIDVEISKKYSHSGTNSLKMSSKIKTTDEAKNSWAVISLSLKNEDGTYNPVNMYDGIAFWIKVERGDETVTPVENEVEVGFKVDMPSHGRFYSTSPIYIMEDGKDITNPTTYTLARDGCMAMEFKPGFSGMIYIPFDLIQGFSATDTIDPNQDLKKIYIMAQLHTLIGYNVYIDDVQGFNMEKLKNVQWPGDPNYDPLTDSMLKISTQKYVSKIPLASKPNANDIIGDKNDGNDGVLPIVLGGVSLVVVIAIVSVAFIIIKKRKKAKS